MKNQHADFLDYLYKNHDEVYNFWMDYAYSFDAPVYINSDDDTHAFQYLESLGHSVIAEFLSWKEKEQERIRGLLFAEMEAYRGNY